MRWRLTIAAAALLAGAAGNAFAQQGGQGITEIQLDLDYYLLTYFNRVAALPKNVDGSSFNAYPAVNFFGPSFSFINHDLDFSGVERTARTSAMGGTGVAFERGSGAMAINPAGTSRGASNELYFGLGTLTGSGSAALTDRLVISTGQIGNIIPQSTTVENRQNLSQGGSYLSARPFFNREKAGGLRGFIGAFTLGAGYRRFVDTYNGTNLLSVLTSEAGVQGEATIRTAGQSREKGGVDALALNAAIGLGKQDSPLSLHVGATANIVNGRIRADQVFTATVLSQVQTQFPGQFAPEAFIAQKFSGETFDFGVQGGLFGDLLSFGAVYRPAYTLRMRNGKYTQVEAPLSLGSISVAIFSGIIADYDMEMPESYKVGGALRLEKLLGDGVDSRGLLGYLHRFFGRSLTAVDYSLNQLSDARIVQKQATITNPDLAEAYESFNLFLQTFGDEFLLDTTMSLQSGNALLRDKETFHVGFETPLVDRWSRLDLRLGYEQVPLAFPSLVLDDPTENVQGGTERRIKTNTDGTPILEDITGDAITLGLGYTAGQVSFDFSLRSFKYDYVTYWGGAAPKQWYNPVTEVYTPILDDIGAVPPGSEADDFSSGMEVSQSSQFFQFAARLNF